MIDHEKKKIIEVGKQTNIFIDDTLSEVKTLIEIRKVFCLKFTNTTNEKTANTIFYAIEDINKNIKLLLGL